MSQSRQRIFYKVIATDVPAFYPNESLVRMPEVQYNDLCVTLATYHSEKHWFWSLFKQSEQDELVNCLRKRRLHCNVKPVNVMEKVD